MAEHVHTVEITLDWSLLGTLSKLDRFDASWSVIERQQVQNLKQLQAFANRKQFKQLMTAGLAYYMAPSQPTQRGAVLNVEAPLTPAQRQGGRPG